MTARRGFEESQHDAAEFLDRVEALREEARAAAREEIRAAALTRDRVESLVRELVARELRTRRQPWWWFGATDASAAGLRVAAAAALVVALLGAGAFAGARLFASGDDAAPVTVATPTPAGAPAAAEAEPAPATPEALAARFDALFTARDSLLVPLVREVERATTSSAVLDAVRAWRGTAPLDATQEERLRSALAQAALNHFVVAPGAALALDGLIRRSPCGGRSCDALLSAWRARSANVPLPPFDAAADPALLTIVERALIMARVEAVSP